MIDRAMCAVVQIWFADTDANLLAVAAAGLIGFLIWESIREVRLRRKRGRERADRERSRHDHWGYV
jgi:hypothetical protein